MEEFPSESKSGKRGGEQDDKRDDKQDDERDNKWYGTPSSAGSEDHHPPPQRLPLQGVCRSGQGRYGTCLRSLTDSITRREEEKGCDAIDPDRAPARLAWRVVFGTKTILVVLLVMI